VRVCGLLHGAAWEGHFIGTDAEAIAYAEDHGVIVTFVESGEAGAYDPRM
jgi:hypothetical protein